MVMIDQPPPPQPCASSLIPSPKNTASLMRMSGATMRIKMSARDGSPVLNSVVLMNKRHEMYTEISNKSDITCATVSFEPVSSSPRRVATNGSGRADSFVAVGGAATAMPEDVTAQ